MGIHLLKLFFVFLISLGLIACAGQETQTEVEDAATSVTTDLAESSDDDSDLEAAGEEESFKIRSAIRDLENKSDDADSSDDDASESEESAATEEKSAEQIAAEKAEAERMNREKLKSWAADELMLTKIYFKYNNDSLDSAGRDIIGLHIDFMKEYPEVSVQLHGHADERGTQEYNLALGDRRANSVAQIFIDNGISPDRIVVISFGENRPIDGDHEENSWAKNRRVEFLYE